MYKISRNAPGALVARCEGTEAAFVLAKSVAVDHGEALIEDTLRGRTFVLRHIEGSESSKQTGDADEDALRPTVHSLLSDLGQRSKKAA